MENSFSTIIIIFLQKTFFPDYHQAFRFKNTSQFIWPDQADFDLEIWDCQVPESLNLDLKQGT